MILYLFLAFRPDDGEILRIIPTMSVEWEIEFEFLITRAVSRWTRLLEFATKPLSDEFGASVPGFRLNAQNSGLTVRFDLVDGDTIDEYITLGRCLFDFLFLNFLFFFQAEDGIRDAQESRGLGDVYKRQI